MLRNMDNIRTNWSEDDDRSMVATRRLAQILNDQGTPASVGRASSTRQRSGCGAAAAGMVHPLLRPAQTVCLRRLLLTQPTAKAQP